MILEAESSVVRDMLLMLVLEMLWLMVACGLVSGCEQLGLQSFVQAGG